MSDEQSQEAWYPTYTAREISQAVTNLDAIRQGVHDVLFGNSHGSPSIVGDYLDATRARELRKVVLEEGGRGEKWQDVELHRPSLEGKLEFALRHLQDLGDQIGKMKLVSELERDRTQRAVVAFRAYLTALNEVTGDEIDQHRDILRTLQKASHYCGNGRYGTPPQSCMAYHMELGTATPAPPAEPQLVQITPAPVLAARAYLSMCRTCPFIERTKAHGHH